MKSIPNDIAFNKKKLDFFPSNKSICLLYAITRRLDVMELFLTVTDYDKIEEE